MFSRSELKYRAKQILRTHYFKLLALSIILAIISGDFINFGLAKTDEATTYAYISVLTKTYTFYNVTLRTIQTISACTGIAILLRVFIFNPLSFGLVNAFVAAERDEFESHRIFMGFDRQHYGNLVKLYVLRDVKLVLYTLLLIVPGIIKAYEYCMIEYIYYDHPNLSITDVFKESKRLTMNSKWDIFVLQLSFFGWYILVALLDVFTFGVAGLMLIPYVRQTFAELYLELDAIHNASPIYFEETPSGFTDSLD